MVFNVEITHKIHGNLKLDNITEIHYCYKSSEKQKKVAFQSDIDFTGYIYYVDEIEEFEATEM